MKSKRQELTLVPLIKGSSFPIDMLRYDQCWPATESDSSKMTHAEDEAVTVCRIASNNQEWTLERWRSFGWVPKGG